MSTAQRRFVLLDRDGTIIVRHPYLSDHRLVELLPKAAEGLRLMREMGLGLVVVTNQSGIGREYFGTKELDLIHKQMLQLLEAEGVLIDGVFCCHHTPDDCCDCRKPRTGLVEQAAESLSFDPSRCFVVGDKPCDINLGKRVNATTFLINQAGEEQSCVPDFVVDNLVDASAIMKGQLAKKRLCEQEDMKPAISIVIPSYNRKSFLKLTIDTVRKELEDFTAGHEIIVVDGGSTDGTLGWLCKQKDIISIIQHNRGVWKGKPVDRRRAGYYLNLAFKSAQGKYACGLSDDCLVVPGSIKNTYKLFEEKIDKGEKVGALAFYWRDWPDENKYHIGFTLGNNMLIGYGLILKQALEDVNYFDEDNYFFYCLDGDLALKMWQAGWVVTDSPDSYIEHYAHATKKVKASNAEKVSEDLSYYRRRWEGVFPDNAQEGVDGAPEKEYSDHANTAVLFKKIAVVRLHLFMLRLRAFLKKIPGLRLFMLKSRAFLKKYQAYFGKST